MFEPERETHDSKLEALIEKAMRAQWALDVAIDWADDVVIPANVPAATYIDLVSQLYYAEEATIEVLGLLLQDVPDFQAKRYLCTQAADEARHARAYSKYLERLGDIAPIDEGLRALLEEGIGRARSYRHRIIALNVVMESEALKQQQKRIETLPCPLFRQINRAIVVDEARHAAFGKIYMRRQLSTASEDERREIRRWIGSLWHLWEAANRGRYETCDVPALKTTGAELGERWNGIRGSLEEIGL